MVEIHEISAQRTRRSRATKAFALATMVVAALIVIGAASVG